MIPATLANAPDDILNTIFKNCDAVSLLSASLVSRLWHKVASDNLLWKQFAKDIPNPITSVQPGLSFVQSVVQDCKLYDSIARKIFSHFPTDKNIILNRTLIDNECEEIKDYVENVDDQPIDFSKEIVDYFDKIIKDEFHSYLKPFLLNIVFNKERYYDDDLLVRFANLWYEASEKKGSVRELSFLVSIFYNRLLA